MRGADTPLQKVDELLSTGGSRTTICEISIQPSKNKQSFIEIEPYSNEEILEFIREVGTYLWNKEHDEDSDTINLPPAELLRAIRNFTGLKISKVDGERIDTASKLAKDSKSKKDFISLIIDRAELENRTQTRLESTSELEDDKQEQSLLSKNFGDLNLGKKNTFSLPKRICVGVSNNLLDFSKYSRFKSIIDTRGMDDSRDRKDLSDYIRNQDDSICIFAEEFLAAPVNVSEFLKRYLTKESRDINNKVALLVLPRKGEPEDVVALDEKVESRQDGIEERKGQIEQAFATEGVKFLTENIFFYDALQFYDENHVLKPYYGEKHINKSRKMILDEIDKLISRRESALLHEAEEYEVFFREIQNGRGLSHEEESMIIDLKKTIEGHIDSGFLSNCEERYKKHLKSYHVMVFRAINNRFGVYDLRDIDIYFDGSTVTEELLRDKLLESKAEIVGAIEFVEEHASEKSGLKPVMKILKDQVDDYFEACIISVGKEVSQFVNDCLSPQSYSNYFWTNIQDRWGDGPGYRSYVLGKYSEEIDGLDNWLFKKVERVWRKQFMSNILDFFG